jgi:hypothetical protein
MSLIIAQNEALMSLIITQNEALMSLIITQWGSNVVDYNSMS